MRAADREALGGHGRKNEKRETMTRLNGCCKARLAREIIPRNADATKIMQTGQTGLEGSLAAGLGACVAAGLKQESLRESYLKLRGDEKTTYASLSNWCSSPAPSLAIVRRKPIRVQTVRYNKEKARTIFPPKGAHVRKNIVKSCC